MPAKIEVHRSPYGTTASGVAVEMFTMTSDLIEVRVITYGARVTSIVVPDRDGERDNVVLGYKDLAAYEADTSYFGAAVGRYANRLAKGQFSLNGKTYQVPVNNGTNALHGGTDSFAQRVWSAEVVDNGVEMTLVSPDGDMGFPGELTVRCRYTLEANALRVDLYATTHAETVVNLTNHSYFNLAGEGNGTIEGAVVQIDADRYVPVDANQIPLHDGESVEGTPFDFRTPHAVGERVDRAGNVQLADAGGYDHTFVTKHPGELREVATVTDPVSGRVLRALTTQPGVHFYSGNSLKGTDKATNGKVIARRGGLCLEMQHFPDSPNHPEFPSTVLKPGEEFHETTVYAFDVI